MSDVIVIVKMMRQMMLVGDENDVEGDAMTHVHEDCDC